MSKKKMAPISANRIGALPDDLLLEILVRLRCIHTGARTSLLARRLRDLWTRLPELTFRGTAADRVDAALAGVTFPALSRIDIGVPDDLKVTPPRIAALIRAAAWLAPTEIRIDACAEDADTPPTIALPLFHRASTSIRLRMPGVRLLLPPAADFTALASLSLSVYQIDLAALFPR